MGLLDHIEIVEVGDKKISRFKTRKIDEYHYMRELGDELKEELPDCISFMGVDFMSSAFLPILVTLDSKLKRDGRYLALTDIRPEIYETFAVTKLDRLFNIQDTLDDVC